MARRSTRPPADSRWKYILLLEDGGAYFGDTVWKVWKEMLWHRWFHFKRGDGWID